MTRKTALTVAFLSITAVAIGWELVGVANPRDNVEPWTFLIADHVPPAITAAAIALLLSWLPGHFIEAYAERGKTMTVPEVPPPGAPKEPLLKVGTVTAVATAAIAVAVAFGLKLTADQTAALLAVIGFLAPLVVAWFARKRVFAPATVRAMVAEAARDGRTKG